MDHVEHAAELSIGFHARRLPELDGWRAFAVLLVLDTHFGLYIRFAPWYNDIMKSGWVAVPLFFVISAMLLAMPFLEAGLACAACPSRERFYARRARRIFPLFYVSGLVYLAVHAAWGAPLPNAGELLRHAFFLNNWQSSVSSINPPYWSLAVEVQFYAVMPFIGVLLHRCARANRFWAALCVGGSIMLVACLYRIAVASQPSLFERYGYNFLVYSSTLANFDSFGAGIVCATLYAWSRRKPPLLSQGAASALTLAALAGVYALMRFAAHHGEAGTLELSCFAPAFFYSLLNCAWAAGIVAALCMRPCAWTRILNSHILGTISLMSYSLYVWQALCLDASERLLEKAGIVQGVVYHSLKLVLECVLVLVIASLSYRFIEPIARPRRPELVR